MEASENSRYKELDGLRGVASLSVLIYHIVMASSATFATLTLIGFGSKTKLLPLIASNSIFATSYLSSPMANLGSVKLSVIQTILGRTPIHLIWAGNVAVIIFFVLSGYVLSLAATKARYRWFRLSYYPRRLLRLYLPLFPAFFLAVILHLAVRRNLIVGASWWLNEHTLGMHVKSALDSVFLISTNDNWAYNSVFWTLQAEVVFSILLPFFLIAIIAVNRNAIAGILGFVALVAILVFNDATTMFYIPAFLIGSLLAFYKDKLPTHLNKTASIVVLTCALLILSTGYFVGGSADPGGSNLLIAVETVGSVLLIWNIIVSECIAKFFRSYILQFFGKRSYSLYLVHEPIVVSLAYGFGLSSNPIILFIISLPICIIASDLFWRFIERPTVNLSRNLVSSISSRFGSKHSEAKIELL